MAVELMEAPDGFVSTHYFFVALWLCLSVFMITLVTTMRGEPISPFFIILVFMVIFQFILLVLLWTGFSYLGRKWSMVISLMIRKLYPVELAFVFAFAGVLIIVDRPDVMVLPLVEKVAYFTLVAMLWILKHSILEAHIKRRNASKDFDTPMTMQ